MPIKEVKLIQKEKRPILLKSIAKEVERIDLVATMGKDTSCANEGGEIVLLDALNFKQEYAINLEVVCQIQ